MAFECPRKVQRHKPDSLTQSFADVSPEAVATWSPAGEKAALYTTSRWPRNTRMHWPVAWLHSRAVPSLEVVSTCSPSGENAADPTAERWPDNTWRHSPEPLLHTLAVPSAEAVMTMGGGKRITETLVPSLIPALSSVSKPLRMRPRKSRHGPPSHASGTSENSPLRRRVATSMRSVARSSMAWRNEATVSLGRQGTTARVWPVTAETAVTSISASGAAAIQQSKPDSLETPQHHSPCSPEARDDR
mmetsp:Transcript_35801/g.99223  ORF Transcript_35801/g.99223 Transcript_35801/m.99223 type:complete len:246 (+) Transcript_35801:883-1620(+)